MSESANRGMVDDINKMSHIKMARMWRFAPLTHVFFDVRYPYYDIFKKRFEKFGGMTTEISKRVGWDK